MFTNRGALRVNYTHKGQAAKINDIEFKNIKYALLFGEHHMFEAEEMKKGLSTRYSNPISEADAVIDDLVA